MKEVFEKAEVSVVEFDTEDVISTSACGGPGATDELEEMNF